MKKTVSTLLILCVLFLTLPLNGCKRNEEPISKTGFYFDTVITITLYSKDAEKHIDECFKLADKYEKLFSTTIQGSDVYNINHSKGESTKVSKETLDLIQAGISYGQKSNGSFDITIGNLTSLWDFSNNKSTIPSTDMLNTAKSTVDYNNISIQNDTVTLTNPDSSIDLGGIAKGYIADQMKLYLLSIGEKEGLINLGGNVLALGAKSGEKATYTIAIQKPFSEDGEAIASIDIIDNSVVTSGTYQRYFKKDNHLFHHILDVKTGMPCNNDLDSVTIISDKSIDGDALSTTVFLMGLDHGLTYVENLADTEAIFITKDGKIKKTSGIGTKIPFQKL